MNPESSPYEFTAPMGFSRDGIKRWAEQSSPVAEAAARQWLAGQFPEGSEERLVVQDIPLSRGAAVCIVLLCQSLRTKGLEIEKLRSETALTRALIEQSLSDDEEQTVAA